MTGIHTLHTPHATVHSSDDAEPWLAWHSMQSSMMWFLQMAQLSTTISAITVVSALSPQHQNESGKRKPTPGPQRNSVPFLDLEPFLSLVCRRGGRRCRRRCCCEINRRLAGCNSLPGRTRAEMREERISSSWGACCARRGDC